MNKNLNLNFLNVNSQFEIVQVNQAILSILVATNQQLGVYENDLAHRPKLYWLVYVGTKFINLLFL